MLEKVGTPDGYFGAAVAVMVSEPCPPTARREYLFRKPGGGRAGSVPRSPDPFSRC